MHVGTQVGQKDPKIRHSHLVERLRISSKNCAAENLHFLASPLSVASPLLCQKVLVVLFASVKARCWLHASNQAFSTIRGLPSLDYFLGSLLLLLVQIPYSRSILTTSFKIWFVHLCPRNDQIFVGHHRWIKFDKQSFRIILDAFIGRICFFTARISHGTSCNSIQFLESELRSG